MIDPTSAKIYANVIWKNATMPVFLTKWYFFTPNIYLLLQHWTYAVSDYISQSILFFLLFFLVFENKSFFLPSNFFDSTSTVWSIPFRGFYKPVFAEAEREHGLYKKIITMWLLYRAP